MQRTLAVAFHACRKGIFLVHGLSIRLLMRGDKCDFDTISFDDAFIAFMRS